MSESIQNTTFQASMWQVSKEIGIGGLAGSAGLSCVVPAINMKNTLQTSQGWGGLKRFVENPRSMMTGLVPITAAGLPANSIAYVVDRSMRRLLSKGENRELTKGEQILASAIGGAISAIVVCPSEMLGVVMNQKAKKEAEEAKSDHREPRKIELKPVIKQIYLQQGMKGFFRGFIPTMQRETIFTIANLVFAANQPGLAAIGGAILSHPADTWKTRMQADFQSRIEFKQFFKSQPMQGIAPRLMAYAIFMYVAPTVRNSLEKTS